MSKLIKKINSLIEDLESRKLQQGPSIDITSQYDKIESLLLSNTKTALSRKSNTLTHQDATGIYKCIFLSVRVKTENIDKGLIHIASDLNALAERNLIHSCLAQPSSVNLARVFGEAASSIVICYVLVPENKMDQVEGLVKTRVEEGGVGEAVDDLSISLADGEFLARLSFSHFPATFSPAIRSMEGRVHDEINAYLSILPKGTTLVSITPLAIVTLAAEYEVKFHNPLMKEYKQVELEYVRDVVRIDDKIEQFNLFTGVKYIRR